MIRIVTKIWYSILVRYFWKKIPGLLKFQATEAESAWQLQRMIPRIEDPEIQRDVFEHYMEEMSHAELFSDQAKKEAIAKGLMAMPKLPVAEREPILSESDDVWKFFAFLSVGEESAVKQFSKITHALPTSPLKSTLKSILRDEAKHVHDAKHHARALALPEDLAEHSRRLGRQRFRSGWMRHGYAVTDALSSALLWLVYWGLAPLGYASARKKIFGKKPSERYEEYPLLFKEAGV